MEKILRCCGTCKYWGLDSPRGYECRHSGFFGGDKKDKQKYPYCKWTPTVMTRVKHILRELRKKQRIK